MPNWKEVLSEIQTEAQKIQSELLKTGQVPSNNALGIAFDNVRQKYIKKISDISGRNVIAYYSGWLQRNDASRTMINDVDKSAFMLTINKLDKSKGLDLILHTPGGDLAATESLVDYLHSIFGNDIRAIIPQIAMSAGTMIALSTQAIIMGKHSNLGPIDPQMGGLPCVAVLEEFNTAIEQIKVSPQSVELWKVIIGKYHPTFLIQCQQSVDWSKNLATEWLARNMFQGDSDRSKAAIEKFIDHKTHKSHSRHLSKQQCADAGLNIINLEDTQDLQDAVLTAHHCFMHSFTNSMALKIVENSLGVSYIENAAPARVQP